AAVDVDALAAVVVAQPLNLGAQPLLLPPQLGLLGVGLADLLDDADPELLAVRLAVAAASEAGAGELGTPHALRRQPGTDAGHRQGPGGLRLREERRRR